MIERPSNAGRNHVSNHFKHNTRLMRMNSVPTQNDMTQSVSPVTAPKWGLVCITISDQVRFRTITRARFLAFDAEKRREVLRELYADNLRRLHTALEFCRENYIGLYRMTSALFPLNDETEGEMILTELAPALAEIGAKARLYDIRVVIHPDQYIVLSSDSASVVATSVHLLTQHGRILDLLGLDRSPWATMILHGGKSDRDDRLVETISMLPDCVKSRLCLENDEYAYGAEDILRVCRRAGIPMVFDAHHHVVHDKLETYEHPSVAFFTDAARETWQVPDWQLVHLSNGSESFRDPKHSDLITLVPSAFEKVSWIEVEAKGKEEAIAALRRTTNLS